MPITRKSVVTPVRTTRSQGSVSEVVTSSAKHVQRKPASAHKNDNVQKMAKPSVSTPEVTRPTRRAAVKVQEEENTTMVKAGKTVDKEESQSVDESRKRSAELAELDDGGGKRRKTSSKIVKSPQVASPRRSSRAVVPNSRYKDMELIDLGKKKAGHREDKSVAIRIKEKSKFDYTSIDVQMQSSEAETVTEEVITETTEIDAQAQLNMFDELLVLPPSSTPLQSSTLAYTASASENESLDTASETLALSTSTMPQPDEIRLDDEIADGREIHQNQINPPLHSETSSGSVISTFKTSGNLDHTRISVEHLKKKIVRSELQHKGKVIVIGSGDLKKKPKRTASANMDSLMVEKVPNESAEGIQIINIANKSSGVAVPAREFIADTDHATQLTLADNGGIKTGRDMFVLGTGKSNRPNEGLSQSGSRILSNNIIDIPVISKSAHSFVSQGIIQQSKSSNTAPQIKVVYVKAKPKPKPDSTLARTVVISKGEVVVNTTQSNQAIDIAGNRATPVEQFLGVQDVLEENYNNNSEIVVNSEVLSTENTLMAEDCGAPSSSIDNNQELYIVPTTGLERSAELGEEGNITGNVAGNASTSTQNEKGNQGKSSNTKRKIDQNLMSSFCEVIEFDKHAAEQKPVTAIEYVMFDNKMVPIHKPFTPSHGRVQSSKPQVKHVHGRVEAASKLMPATVKKVPVSAIQSVIQSVIDHRTNQEDADLTSVEIINKSPVDTDQETDGKPPGDTELSEQMVQAGLVKADNSEMEDSDSKDVLSSATSGKVFHGYINHPAAQGSEETKIVEISPDMFTKEVFGDTVVLDSTTGELIPQSANNVSALIVSHTDVQAETSVAADPVSPTDDCINTLSDGVADIVPVDTVETITSSGSISDTGPSQHMQTVVTESVTSHGTVGMEDPEALIDVVDMGSDKAQVTEIRTSGTVAQVGQSASANTTIAAVSAEEGSAIDDNVVIHIENDGAPHSTTYTLEKMADGEEALVLHIDESSFLRIEEKPESSNNVVEVKGQGDVLTQQLREVKINPGIPVKVSTGVPGSRSAGVLVSRAGAQRGENYVALKAGSSTSDGQTTEIETQTEYSEMSDDEEEDEEKPADTGSEPRTERVVIVNPRGDDTDLKRTKVVLHEDGRYQEYVMVHLPEGTEIRNKGEERSQREEIVTMSEDGMYLCLDCGHKTFKKGNWYKHRRKHLGIRPHACSKCSYRAATSSNLKRHMEIHDDVRNFTCTICGLLFRQKIHLERHIKYKHQEKKVKCPLCDYMCASENPDLKIHIRKRHMPQEDGSMSAFTCDECGLMTVSKKDLKQHLKFHKKGPELKLFCEFCSFVTDCESRLRRHMLIHTKERPFQCGLCEYRGSQKEHVLRHMRSQHDIEIERNPRKQSILDDMDGSKTKLRRSLLDGFDPCSIVQKGKIEELDVSERPFEKSDYSSTDKIFACNHCTMKFAKLINLYKHLYAQHKQVMPDPTLNDFQCVVCDFRTNSKKNLLVHMRRHNMQDHTPPSHVYSCVLCRYINPRRRNLFQHMKKKHGIEIMMKEDGTNCYVTSDNSYVVLGQQGMEDNVMALSEIVTTHTLDDDSQLQIVTEDGEEYITNKIAMETMSMDDIAYTSVSQDSIMSSAQIASAALYQPTVAEHEAAEAIEGLQALAQQAGIVETQTMDGDITGTEEELQAEEILTAGEIITAGEETLIDDGQSSSGNNGIQLSTEQFNQLSSGDYVEINGEVYKVEIAQDQDGQKME